ncbi:MAG: hypothetical protein Kow0020_05890 [Wenzhouxiangellaceae bacterium]
MHDPRSYRRVLAQGSLGAGNVYMDGWLYVQQDGFIHLLLRARLEQQPGSPPMLWQMMLARGLNRRSRRRSRHVARQHTTCPTGFIGRC